MPELRLRRFWMLCGLCIALLIAILSLVPNNQLPDVDVSDKFEHIAAFLLLAFWFGSIVARRDYHWVALALLAFGVLIELLQGWMGLGRQADLLDVRADCIGIVLGLLLALTPAARWPSWLESMLRKAAS
ncbi:MAG: VanZ family protein [Steroidobacteraceae bacterium]